MKVFIGEEKRAVLRSWLRIDRNWGIFHGLAKRIEIIKGNRS